MRASTTTPQTVVAEMRSDYLGMRRMRRACVWASALTLLWMGAHVCSVCAPQASSTSLGRVRGAEGSARGSTALSWASAPPLDASVGVCVRV